MKRVATLVLALGLAAATPAAARAQACPEGVGAPSARSAWRAELLAPAPARTYLSHAPSLRVRPGDASALLVLAAPRISGGRCFVKVRLPRRPNDANAWIDAGRVELHETPWRIEVDRAGRRVSVLRAGRVARRFAAVVGAPATPTPTGLFAVADVWRWKPGDFLGAWILALTARSNVLQEFDGGDGQIALHGRGGASLLDPLGSAASHGCVRLSNAAISWLVRTVGADRLPGTPVRVR
ncbi:MAG TPA: L,D-transpeptidase [Solirubrobacter sp.]|nr:L,D-transpeptidase [Solirubrobacter sp.]